MKAIYINIDPYLAAVAAWLNAGKPGTAPKFDPLPLAVTIPLGETAVVYSPGDTDGVMASFSVDGVIVGARGSGQIDATVGTPIASYINLGFSEFSQPGEDWPQQYSAIAVAGDFVATIEIHDEDDTTVATVTIPVLVRREQASGPVDLVDFTPPAAAPSAAGIKSALVAAGEGALAGVHLDGAIIHATGDAETATLYTGGDTVSSLKVDLPSDLTYALGGTSVS